MSQVNNRSAGPSQECTSDSEDHVTSESIVNGSACPETSLKPPTKSIQNRDPSLLQTPTLGQPCHFEKDTSLKLPGLIPNSPTRQLFTPSLSGNGLMESYQKRTPPQAPMLPSTVSATRLSPSDSTFFFDMPGTPSPPARSTPDDLSVSNLELTAALDDQGSKRQVQHSSPCPERGPVFTPSTSTDAPGLMPKKQSAPVSTPTNQSVATQAEKPAEARTANNHSLATPPSSIRRRHEGPTHRGHSPLRDPPKPLGISKPSAFRTGWSRFAARKQARK